MNQLKNDAVFFDYATSTGIWTFPVHSSGSVSSQEGIFLSSSSPSSTSEASNFAASFDGNLTCIKIPPADFANNSEMSFAVWFNPNSTIQSGSDRMAFIVKNTVYPKNGDYWLGHGLNGGSNGRIQFIHQGGGGVKTTNTSWSVGTWYHVAVTFKNGSPTKIYVNGVLNNTGTDGSTIGDNGDPLYIGRNHGDIGRNHGNKTEQAPFDGLLDDVLIYDRELSATEIEDIYYSFNRTKPTANLILDYDFNMIGSRLNDASTRNNDGTASGGLAFVANLRGK